MSAAHGCSRSELNTGGRRGHEARDMAINLSRERTGEKPRLELLAFLPAFRMFAAYS